MNTTPSTYEDANVSDGNKVEVETDGAGKDVDTNGAEVEDAIDGKKGKKEVMIDLDDDLNESDYEEEIDNNDDDELFIVNVEQESEWLGNYDALEMEYNDSENESIYESGDEDLIKSDDDLSSVKESEDDGERTNYTIFNSSQIFTHDFQLGMMFSTKTELRHAIHSHAITTKKSINITKNDKTRLHAKCENKDCVWKLHALKLTGESTFQIRKNIPNHICGVNFFVKNLKSSWLSKKYVNKFKSDPKRNVKGFKIDVIEDLRCHISDWQAYRAKSKAIEMLEGFPEEQYSLLWDFADEVKRTNPMSTVIIGTDQSTGENRFQQFYLCLYALKYGFLSGCRPFIGVDGCHLKGPHRGVILTAVGVDPNNNTFPIAFAIVNSENMNAWEWFLTLLKLDLNIVKDYEWTFMSDKQKGLIQAFNQIFPNAEHRFCVRHLLSNFKNAGFRGQSFKSALWNCAKATTVNDFGRKMKGLKDIDETAASWFDDKPPQHWSKSHFGCNSSCDTLLNNGCESFNSSILEARDRPVVSMCEWIFEYLMKRMQINRNRAGKRWKGVLCPKIQKIIDHNCEKMGDCLPIKADDSHYQISCYDGTRYAVDLKNRTCGCRRWDLSGIPCKHALCAIFYEGHDYYKYTHNCYTVDNYKIVYGQVIFPINGRHEWKKSDLIPMLPPNFGRPAGRPKKARRRERDEPELKQKKKSRGKTKKNPHAMRRQQKTVKCGLCGVAGHNKRACTREITISNVTESEPMNVSLDQSMSQLTQKLPTERPSNLQVTSSKDKGNNAINSLLLNTEVAASIPPSMFEQFTQCQSCTTAKPVIGGHEYVRLSNLASALSRTKYAKENKRI